MPFVHRFIARLTRSLLISDLAQRWVAPLALTAVVLLRQSCRSCLPPPIVGWRHCHGCRSAPSAQPWRLLGGRCWVDCACCLCGCAWSAHHPGPLDAVTAVVSDSSVLPCACPVVGRVHDSVHVTAVVLLRQRRVPAPSSGGSMTLHLSRLPFCFVSHRVPAPSLGGS